MSGGGGKGGTQTTEVRIDPRLEAASAAAAAGALQSAGLDYVPNRGVTISSFTPQQLAAFEGANTAANAYGLPTGGVSVADSMPTPEANSMGILGYSTGGAYDEALAASMTQEQMQERQDILDYYSQSGQDVANMRPRAPARGGK